MDTKGIAKLIKARAARLHAAMRGPKDPSEVAALQDHEKRLNELDSDVVIAKLSINDQNLDENED